MYSESYESYSHCAPSSYGLHNSAQMFSADVSPTEQPSYDIGGACQTQAHFNTPPYYHPSQDEVYHQSSGYADPTDAPYSGYHTAHAAPPIDAPPYGDRNPLSFGSSAYPASAIRTTSLPLHSPHPVSTASAPLLSASYAPSQASSYLPSEHYGPASAPEGPRRMSVPELHSQHYQASYVQAHTFHSDVSRRQSVPNLHYHPDSCNSYGPLASRPGPSHFAVPDAVASSPVFISPDYSAPSTSASAGYRTQLATQGSGADLMHYYANLDREAFQTPCQLLDTLLKTNSSGPGYSQVDPVPVEQQREEKKQTETSRQARLRYMSESVGFQPTDPDTLSCHEKKRYYIECLEVYVGWLRAQCEVVQVDAGDIQRMPGYKGLNTRSVRTMIVHMQKMLRTDHIDTLREEGDFLHLRERVLAQEEEQANAALHAHAHARRGF